MTLYAGAVVETRNSITDNCLIKKEAMKQVMKVTISRFFLLCLFNVLTVVTWAQEGNEGGSETRSTTTTTTKSTDITITTDANTWYTQPWVWIVGAAVFILLLVALLSSGKGRDTKTTTDRLVVKKTVERNSENT